MGPLGQDAGRADARSGAAVSGPREGLARALHGLLEWGTDTWARGCAEVRAGRSCSSDWSVGSVGREWRGSVERERVRSALQLALPERWGQAEKGRLCAAVVVLRARTLRGWCAPLKCWAARAASWASAEVGPRAG